MEWDEVLSCRAAPARPYSPHGGEPRIYELALEYVAHCEAQVHLPELAEFLSAYQRAEPLSMAELWAMPLTLSLALIESVAHVAHETARRQDHDDRAAVWANRLLTAAGGADDRLLFLLADLARAEPAPSPCFADRLLRQLEGEPPVLDPIRAWVERKLGMTVAEMVHSEQLRQARDPAQRYRVEPYAVAADVYALDGHVGQGGWTWYTGSSGWMYRVWLEDVLGFKLRGDRLDLAPALPAAWGGCVLHYRYRGAHHETPYVIAIGNPSPAGHGVAWLEVDGERRPQSTIQLEDDGKDHRIVVRLG